MTEGARYPSLHHTDHLGGNPIYTLSPYQIQRAVGFTDKMKVESIVPETGSIS